MSDAAATTFHIHGSNHPRPEADRVIYADGAGAIGHRPGVDLELSHWVPNETPERYRADTSTEICLRFVEDPARAEADLVVNDHVDVDGILSLYVLLHPDTALAHRDTLVAAAAMGDFHAWADRPGFELAQELSLLVATDRPPDPGDCYAAAFELTTAHLLGERPTSDAVARGLAVMDRCRERLDRDVTVERTSERIVGFVLPDRSDLDRMLRVPPHNAVVDDSVWLWPEARNREHGERVQVVSVPSGRGWYHDVWAPTYCWARTPDRWTMPGLVSTGDSNRWKLDHPPLHEAVARLADLESADGRWRTADELTPFSALASRAFPVVASFVDASGAPAPSDLSPDRVARELAPVW